MAFFYNQTLWTKDSDSKVALIASLLILFGFLFIFSSSMYLNLNNPYHYVVRQFLFMATGVGVYQIAKFMGHYRFLFQVKGLWLLMVFLLILPLTHLGSAVNGAKRWIQFYGFSFQLTEFVKILWIFFIAKFSYDYHVVLQKDVLSTFSLWIKLLVILFLLLLQPDFGSAAVLLFLTLSVLFIARVRIDFFFGLVLAGLTILTGLIFIAPYRTARLMAFLDPWTHSQNQGYQLIQSLIAIGSGGLFGKGFGESLQKHNILPESHTDFIFSIIVEETGFVGSCIFLALYFYFVCLLIRKGMMSSFMKDYLVCYSFLAAAILFFMEFTINLGVCLGLLPTKGIALPFFSYGGSSLWSSIFLIGTLDGMYQKK